MSKYLWDRPEGDLTYQRSEWLRDNTQEDETIGVTYGALCNVYYSVFNNGGCNLELPHLQQDLRLLEEAASSFDLDCPEFIWVVYEDEVETIDVNEMDRFARELIDHLYLSLNPEIDYDY